MSAEGKDQSVKEAETKVTDEKKNSVVSEKPQSSDPSSPPKEKTISDTGSDVKKNETDVKKDEKREDAPTPDRASSRGSEVDPSKAGDARPRSSESSGRPKSSGSVAGGGTTVTKGRRKKKLKVDPNAHAVTFTVTISLAIPTGNCLA